ncbi:hypothetical protein GCM10020295_51100 [Streptomyces cinereospinus]
MPAGSGIGDRSGSVTSVSGNLKTEVCVFPSNACGNELPGGFGARAARSLHHGIRACPASPVVRPEGGPRSRREWSDRPYSGSDHASKQQGAMTCGR